MVIMLIMVIMVITVIVIIMVIFAQDYLDRLVQTDLWTLSLELW
jgi:hypothetical protein